MKATNKSFPMMMLLLNSVLAKNKEKCVGKTAHFIDSTPVEVYKNNQHPRRRASDSVVHIKVVAVGFL